MGHIVKIGLVLAISVIVITGFNFTPAFGSTHTYDGGCTPTCDPQDWFTGGNWEINAIPNNNDVVNIGLPATNPGPFAVNIGDGTSPGDTFTNTGTLSIITIFGDQANSLTIKEFSSLINDDSGGVGFGGIVVHSGATLNVDGLLSNLQVTDKITVDGLIVVTDTGTFESFGDILGTGEIQCVGNGTFDQLGTIEGTVTVTNCGGAPVGSISIPLDSTSMLVAGNQFDTLWLLPAIAVAVGVGIILVRKNYFSSE